MHIAVIDVGSPKNLGWAIEGNRVSEQGGDLAKCVKALGAAMQSGPLALGFEAPLFVPMREDVGALTKARNGECMGGVNRPFSAGAGAAVLVTSLTIVPYVLSELRAITQNVVVTFDWRTPLQENSLLLFEAFVSNQKKTASTRHVEDAVMAIATFRQGMKEPSSFESAVCEMPCFNLLGAMLLRTGWVQDASILAQPCLVMRS